ncbi:hypothetical protein BKA82DRAFT_874103 [Pisolithus tinctorius]|uniref:Uncharacterized protein n=1 Tax=Pisolithus tinctorius Marx 270 TaxID=870435 RepID=A0A0C3PPA5_PISTI|nr:hypothetical protein BKA82DRAFT_874103 [Pisolithus tinctorius]KIO10746.1 hypothetical protein M404DRAFT_874103 [Pisolithus tinctorius Marx 270]
MARTQSRKRRGLGFARASDSSAGFASVHRRSEARAGDFASLSEPSNMASPGLLARMRRFFHGSNRGPSTTIATETTATGTSGRAPEQQEQSQAIPDQDVAATGTSGGAQEQQQKPLMALTEEAKESIAKSEPEPTPASAGKEIDAAVKNFGGIDAIPHIAKTVVDAVGIANTTPSEIQILSDAYLKPFKVFNQIASTLANVSTSLLASVQ